jgi:hypothetical protein
MKITEDIRAMAAEKPLAIIKSEEPLPVAIES